MIQYLKEGKPPPPDATDDVKRTVSEMLTRIENEGGHAVREYSRKLDAWNPPSFRVHEDAVRSAEAEISADLRRHIAFAQEQVAGFARYQLATMSELTVETLPGVVLGHRHLPVASVGAYVPGGRYPMLASAFMTVLVAKIAGVGRVVACAPPHAGQGIHPAMLYAIATSGADEIVCLGGVQALAALAFGIDDVEPVEMIVGAGNAYVAEAKRQLFGHVGIDLLAGPTEILVIADASADAELIAADLLGQAEHGPSSPAILLTTSAGLGAKVSEQINRLLAAWPTAEVAGEAWRNYGTIAVAASREEAVAAANHYACEHVEVQVREEELDFYFERLRNYGSLFLGTQATVVYGDKAIGTNHVLPTSGAARYTGGLWVGKFLKTVTYQRLTEDGTRHVAPASAAISEAERFGGHAITARMRLERLQGGPDDSRAQPPGAEGRRRG